MEERIFSLLKEFSQKIKIFLNHQYVGVYLHGSLALGCFHPQKSDVDVLLVVEYALSRKQKEKLMEEIIKLHNLLPHGLEISVVLKQYCQNFEYPTPYELHFSPMHLSKYLDDPLDYICTMNGTDRDLAAHMTIVYRFGKVIDGQEISEVFSRVPDLYYLDSLYYDMENYQQDVKTNPMYVILSLCRILAFVQSHLYLSKEQAAYYGLKHLPLQNHEVILKALSCYQSDEIMQVNEEIEQFVRSVSLMILQNNQ